MNRCVKKQRYCGPGRLKGQAILMMVALSVLLSGLAGCSQLETTTPSQTTSTQATASSAQTSNSTTGSQTTSGGHVTSPDRFSPSDLTVNGIPVGASPQEAEQVLGVPKESRADIDQVSGLDVLTYIYDGLQMIFMKGVGADSAFHLQYVEVTGRAYVLARGLRVGDTAPDALRLFHRDPHAGDYKGYTVLYGDPNLLDRQDTASEVAFAYYDEREVYFLHMKPPYMTGSATTYDEMAVLRLSMENQIVTKAFWMLGAGAE